MTRDTEPHDPRHPQDPPAEGPRRRGLGAGFWAMIVFGFLCAVAGLAVAKFGPALFPAHPAGPAVHAPPPRP
jgi:hypothetical protein